MADPGEDEDYDLKDEELVDFDGSDYGFESGEEEEEISVAPEAPLPTTKTALAPKSGEIDDVKDGQGDGVVVQPPLVVVVDHPPKRKLPPKPDLEDGELDDAAMPEGSDPEAVANGGDEDEGGNDRREWKRRKDRYIAERQLDNKGRDAEERALAHGRQFRGRGSDKMHGSQRINYSRGSKGANAAPFKRGNSGPGIMGPGRPPVSTEYGGHMPLRFMGRGFPRPIGGVVAPGRLNQTEVNRCRKFPHDCREALERYSPCDTRGRKQNPALNLLASVRFFGNFMHTLEEKIQRALNMQYHIRDSMAVQEHMLRHQQLVQMAQEQVQHAQKQAAQAQAQVQSRAQAHAHVQQAHAQARAHAHAQAQVHVHIANSGALRASLSGSTMRPIMGLDLIGGQIQASHSVLHLQVQTLDSGPQIHYPRPLEGFGTRGPQGTDFSVVRGIVGGPLLNQPCNRERTAAGRKLNAWSPSSAVQHEISNMPAARGRAQGQSRDQVMSPLWVEPPVSGILTGFPSPVGVISHSVPVHGSSGIASGGVVALGTPKRQGSLLMMMPNNTATNRETGNMKKVDIRPRVDGPWRSNGGNRGGHYNNGTPACSSRNASAVWSNSSPGDLAGNKRSRENELDQRHSSKPTSLRSVGNGVEASGNNLIQLGGPVTKSRVVSVSGFAENTSMAVVVEAFEKQGKILDFKKDERSDAFHITFSSVAEAVSAKRSLHRTLLNGRQITVDYTVQRY